MNLNTYTSRELRRRPGRTLLTLAGIVIGVAAIVAVALASATARDAFRNMFDQVGGKAELEVVGAVQGTFDPTPVESTVRVPGVEAVVPLIQTQTAIPVSYTHLTLPTIYSV